MLRQGVVELGPKYGKVKMGKPNSSKNENNILSCLLRDFDESPSRSKVSELAKLVLSDLLDEGSIVHCSYEDFRNAGASLTFLRFHLNVPEAYFNKNGSFHCTADELFDAKFDLLFCINRAFTSEELITAGFKEGHVNKIFNNFQNCKLEDLESFGPELFEMNFYAKQLRDCKAFSDMEVLKWFDAYKLKLQSSVNDELSISSKYSKPLSEPLFEKPERETRSKTYANQKPKEKCKREAFTIEYKLESEGTFI